MSKYSNDKKALSLIKKARQNSIHFLSNEDIAFLKQAGLFDSIKKFFNKSKNTDDKKPSTPPPASPVPSAVPASNPIIEAKKEFLKSVVHGLDVTNLKALEKPIQQFVADLKRYKRLKDIKGNISQAASDADIAKKLAVLNSFSESIKELDTLREETEAVLRKYSQSPSASDDTTVF